MGIKLKPEITLQLVENEKEAMSVPDSVLALITQKDPGNNKLNLRDLSEIAGVRGEAAGISPTSRYASLYRPLV